MEEVKNIPEDNLPAPKRSHKSTMVVFILLGALTAGILFAKQGSSIFKSLSSIKITNPNPFLLTPTPKLDLPVLITNSDNNKTISVSKNETIKFELRLNRKAENKIQTDNNKVLAITEVMKYDQTKDVFLATIKAVDQGNAVITVTEQPKAIKILQINITVK